MSGDEFEVDRGVSRFGVHYVHLLGTSPIDREAVLGRETPPEAQQVEWHEYQDEVGMYHLKLWWKEKGARCYEWIL